MAIRYERRADFWKYADFWLRCVGVNIDFAGLAVERLTGLSLNDYCHKHIFEPLGLRSICESNLEDHDDSI